MLSLADSDSSLWRDRTASTLDTIASVGMCTKDKKRHKTDDNWVRNISSRPLDKTETQVLSYGLKHSVTPKHIPTEAIVSSVEVVLSRQRELSEVFWKINVSHDR